VSRIAAVLAVAIVAAHAPGVPAPKARPDANLIVNGSFEEGPDDVGVYKSLDPGSTAIKGWKVTRGQIDYVGTNWVSADGNRNIDLHGSPGKGGVAQEFATVKGKKYGVKFQMASSYGKGKQGIIVEAAGQKETFTTDGTGTTPATIGWTRKSWEFTATGDRTTIEFRTEGTGDEYCGPVLDDVVVTEAR
jgi:choice-of-anchor C domain-containing protein